MIVAAMRSRLASCSRVVSVVAIASACAGSGGLNARAAAPAMHHPTMPTSGELGHDVGTLSCQAPLPTGGTFGVVAATAGRPFFVSPCLSSEYAWASALTDKPQFYFNLANPGRKSKHWGHGGPKACRKKQQQVKYDAGCAFDYGYRAAATALNYTKRRGSTGHGRWWLDVETDNTWGTSRAGLTANIADIRGAVTFLRAQPKISVGIYTETTWWNIITDDSSKFSGVAVWGGGADTRHHAKLNCRQHSITGGPALLVQWIDRVHSIDNDLAC